MYTLAVLTIVLFTFTPDFSSQTDFWPADILSSTHEVWEGDMIKLKCVFKKNGTYRGELQMYLCKDRVGIRMVMLAGSKDTTFTLADVGKKHSGNYSCVYSKAKHSLAEVSSVGEKTVFVHVKDFGGANVFIRNPSVPEGNDVDVKCLALETTTQKAFHMYLCKNSIAFSMEVFYVSSNAHFTITKVRGEDSGNYSCVYSKKKHAADSVRCWSANSVTLQVTVSATKEMGVPAKMDFHLWRMNVIRLLFSAVVMAALTVVTYSHFRSTKETLQGSGNADEGDSGPNCIQTEQLYE